MTLINDLGDDADLLTYSDPWLASQKLKVAQEMNRLSQEYRSLQLAQTIKGRFHQQNIVAVQRLLRDAEGNIVDVVVNLASLPDAIQTLSQVRDPLDAVNREAQFCCWRADGHDLETAAALRQ